MTPSEWANTVLAVFTMIGVGVIGFVLVMGVKWLLGYGVKTDNYQSERVRKNLYKVPR